MKKIFGENKKNVKPNYKSKSKVEVVRLDYYKVDCLLKK